MPIGIHWSVTRQSKPTWSIVYVSLFLLSVVVVVDLVGCSENNFCVSDRESSGFALVLFRVACVELSCCYFLWHSFGALAIPVRALLHPSSISILVSSSARRRYEYADAISLGIIPRASRVPLWSAAKRMIFGQDICKWTTCSRQIWNNMLIRALASNWMLVSSVFICCQSSDISLCGNFIFCKLFAKDQCQSSGVRIVRQML